MCVGPMIIGGVYFNNTTFDTITKCRWNQAYGCWQHFLNFGHILYLAALPDSYQSGVQRIFSNLCHGHTGSILFDLLKFGPWGHFYLPGGKTCIVRVNFQNSGLRLALFKMYCLKLSVRRLYVVDFRLKLFLCWFFLYMFSANYVGPFLCYVYMYHHLYECNNCLFHHVNGLWQNRKKGGGT